MRRNMHLKTLRISLAFKLVPVPYREYKYGPLETKTAIVNKIVVDIILKQLVT